VDEERLAFEGAAVAEAREQPTEGLVGQQQPPQHHALEAEPVEAPSERSRFESSPAEGDEAADEHAPVQGAEEAEEAQEGEMQQQGGEVLDAWHEPAAAAELEAAAAGAEEEGRWSEREEQLERLSAVLSEETNEHREDTTQAGASDGGSSGERAKQAAAVATKNNQVRACLPLQTETARCARLRVLLRAGARLGVLLVNLRAATREADTRQSAACAGPSLSSQIMPHRTDLTSLGEPTC
jgi:hypothetical protein